MYIVNVSPPMNLNHFRYESNFKIMGLFYALSLAINTLVEHRNKGDDESLRQTTFAVQIIG